MNNIWQKASYTALFWFPSTWHHNLWILLWLDLNELVDSKQNPLETSFTKQLYLLAVVPFPNCPFLFCSVLISKGDWKACGTNTAKSKPHTRRHTHMQTPWDTGVVAGRVPGTLGGTSNSAIEKSVPLFSFFFLLTPIVLIHSSKGKVEDLDQPSEHTLGFKETRAEEMKTTQ